MESSVTSTTTTSTGSSSSPVSSSSMPPSGTMSPVSWSLLMANTSSSSYSPKASAAAITTVFDSPGAIPTSASSICGKKSSSPMVSSMGPLSQPQPSSLHSSSSQHP